MPIRILFVIFLLVSFFGFSQENSTDIKKCQQFKTLGDKYFANNDFPQAVAFYQKSELFCDQFEKAAYDKLVLSIKNSLTNSKDKITRSNYIDTLVNVYSRSEINGFYDQNNDLVRATFIIKSSKPDLKKVDDLFVRAMKNKSLSLSETQLTLYFSNLYALYQGIAKEEKSVFKRRLIKEYFELQQVIVNQNMGEGTKSNLDTYFNNIIKDCSDIAPDIEFYINTLSKTEKEKHTELSNFRFILEKNNCIESSIYKGVIDSLIYIEPSTDLYLASAKCLSNRKEYSKEFSTLYFAKKMAKDESIMQEIDFLSALSLYNASNYSEAYKIAITVKGKYYGESQKIAAQSVIMSKESCGENSILQKLNLYYALDLLSNANKAGLDIQNIIKEQIAQLPTENELRSIKLKKGQQVTLACWGIQIVIPE